MFYKVMPKKKSHEFFRIKMFSKQSSIGPNAKFFIAIAHREFFNYSKLLLRKILKRLDADLHKYFFLIASGIVYLEKYKH